MKTKNTTGREERDDWGDIVFYQAVRGDGNGGDSIMDYIDVIYCPRSWDFKKVQSKFKKRNPEWDFKNSVMIGLLINRMPEIYPLPQGKK